MQHAMPKEWLLEIQLPLSTLLSFLDLWQLYHRGSEKSLYPPFCSLLSLHSLKADIHLSMHVLTL